MLHRDLEAPGRYVTVDTWRSEEAYRAFRADSAAAFEALDEACQALTLEETFVGSFSCVEVDRSR